MTPRATPAERITAFDGFSPKQKTVARFLLDDQLAVAFASANEIGDMLGVSAATVVRFAQALGYSGFPELQQAIREQLPTYLTAVQRIERRLNEREPTEQTPLLDRVFALDLRNVQRTARLVESDTFEAAAGALVQASDILVIGSGLSAVAATFLAHSLRVAGFSAQAIAGGVQLAVELAHLQPTSVVVGISLWRYLKDTVCALELAKRKGVRIVAITDNALSPLARLADHTFIVATDAPGFSLSLTGLMALMNAFISAVAERVPERTAQALREVDGAYREEGLLYGE